MRALIVCALCLSVGCFKEPASTGSGDEASGDSSGGADESSGSTGEAPVVEWGARKLSGLIAANSPQNHAAQLETARQLGMDGFRLDFGWTELRPDCQGPVDVLPISDLLAHYAGVESALTLDIALFLDGDTELPDGLPDDPRLDDPEVIDCFVETMMAAVSLAEESPILTLIISDSDEFIAASEDNVVEFYGFYVGVQDGLDGVIAEHSVKLTAATVVLAPDLAGAFHEISDFVAIQVDPIDANFQLVTTDVVGTTLDAIAPMYPGRTIRVFTGYPSSDTEFVGSSQERQAQFVVDTFAAWDEHIDQVDYLSIGFVFDPSESLFTDEWPAEFLAYFGTQGLFTRAGTAKRSGDALMQEIALRTQ